MANQSNCSGRIVITKNGDRAIAYNRDFGKNQMKHGKQKVYLIDDDGNPLLDEDGVQLKMMCNPMYFKLIGFID